MWHWLRSLAKMQQVCWHYFVTYPKVSKIWHFIYQWIISLRIFNCFQNSKKFDIKLQVQYGKKNKVEKKVLFGPHQRDEKCNERGNICEAVGSNTDCHEEVKFVRWKDINILTVCFTAFGTEPIKKVQRWSRIEKKKIGVCRDR